MSLKTRVEAYAGSINNDTLLSTMLTASAKYIIDILPPTAFLEYATEQSVGTSGYGIQSQRIIYAHKNGYPARYISAAMRAGLTNPNSINYASNTDPAYYIQNGMVYIVPGGGVVALVQYPIVTCEQEFIYQMPPGLDEAVVILAAIKSLIKKGFDCITDLGNVAVESVTPPTAPEAPSFSYTNATLGTYTPTSIMPTMSLPTYIPPISEVDLTNATTYISVDEDLDKAQIELAKQNAAINKYSTDMQNRVSQFNVDVENYRNHLNVIMENARLAQQRILQQANDTKDLNLQNEMQQLAKQVQEYSSKIGVYQQEVQAYSANVVAVVNKAATQAANISARQNAIMQQIVALEKQLNVVLSKYMGEPRDGLKG